MSNKTSNYKKLSHNFLPFNDDFLLYFLPMLGDEEQRRLREYEEEDDLLFEDFGFDEHAEDDDFEEGIGIDDDND